MRSLDIVPGMLTGLHWVGLVDVERVRLRMPVALRDG